MSNRALKKIIYIAGPVKGDRSLAPIINGLILHLMELGHTVLSEHIIFDEPNAELARRIGNSYADFTPEDIELTDTNWLDEATLVIAEVSLASTGTGRNVEYARIKGQRDKTPANILCVYNSKYTKSAS